MYLSGVIPSLVGAAVGLPTVEESPGAARQGSTLSTSGQRESNPATLQSVNVISGHDVPDGVGQIATCFLVSSSDLLSVTFSAASIELLTDVVEVRYGDPALHLHIFVLFYQGV